MARPRPRRLIRTPAAARRRRAGSAHLLPSCGWSADQDRVTRLMGNPRWASRWRTRAASAARSSTCRDSRVDRPEFATGSPAVVPGAGRRGRDRPFQKPARPLRQGGISFPTTCAGGRVHGAPSRVRSPPRPARAAASTKAAPTETWRTWPGQCRRSRNEVKSNPRVTMGPRNDVSSSSSLAHFRSGNAPRGCARAKRRRPGSVSPLRLVVRLRAPGRVDTARAGSPDGAGHQTRSRLRSLSTAPRVGC